MSTLEDHYPTFCPFCNIAAAYPSPSPTSTPNPSAAVPANPDPNAVDPACYLLYSSPHVLAFLDILPISPGHILLTTRDHYRTLSDLLSPRTNSSPSTGLWDAQHSRHRAEETSRALGATLPLLSLALKRATGIEDWNVVQNNGERAAQVVPHVHFHLIPRYQEGRGRKGKGDVDVGMLKSWRMFGRGTREELDEEEAGELAERLRGALREELEGRGKRGEGSKL